MKAIRSFETSVNVYQPTRVRPQTSCNLNSTSVGTSKCAPNTVLIHRHSYMQTMSVLCGLIAFIFSYQSTEKQSFSASYCVQFTKLSCCEPRPVPSFCCFQLSCEYRTVRKKTTPICKLKPIASISCISTPVGSTDSELMCFNSVCILHLTLRFKLCSFC
jgi:hypothetical protein